MHRCNLLEQLHAYGVRYPEERQMLERFIRFVESEPRCFERDCWTGHVTGSAWLLDKSSAAVLLTHHKKLDKWLQLGGHSDGDADSRRVALREAREESGLVVKVLLDEILDIDIHAIPARKSDPAHYHFDVRYACIAEQNNYAVSEESNALAWVSLADLESVTSEASILRMGCKWRDLTST